MRSLYKTYKEHYRALIKLGMPIVVGQIGMIILSVADTMMIGHYGKNELAAASFVNILFDLCIIFSIGFSYGLTPIVSELYGKKRNEEAGQALYCSQIANVMVAVMITIVMGVLYFFVGDLGQPEELMPLIRPYYLVLLSSILFVLLFNGFKQFTDGLTMTKMAMWILLGGNAMNIVGNYILIYGKLGLPEMGLLGAGISTLASRIMMVIVFFGIVVSRKEFKPFVNGIKEKGWSKPMFVRLNKLGWPVAAQMGMETAAFSLSIIMVGWLGTTALAAHNIMNTISKFTFMIYYGIGAAVAIRVSHFKGQDDVENIRRSATAGFHLTIAVAAILLTGIFIVRNQMGGWFNDDQQVIEMVSSLFFVFLIYQFGDGLQINYANALRGISDVVIMIYVAAVSYFLIALPAGYYFGFVLGWGLPGVWMAFPFGLSTCGVLLWLRFRRKTK